MQPAPAMLPRSHNPRQQLPSVQPHPPRPAYYHSPTRAPDDGYSIASYQTQSPAFSEYDYDSSNLAPPRGFKNQSQLEALGSRVYSAITENNKPLHARAKSIADAAAPMLARTTSIRLGGLLNRTPTQKPSKSAQQDEEDHEEPDDMPEYKPTLTSTPERSSRRGTPRTQTPSRQSQPPARQGRFSWFAAPNTTASSDSYPSHVPSTAALELQDPLLALNVNAALFPAGAADPLDPASFNDLLHNACALIERLQRGYTQKTQLLRQAHAERDAALEEKAEAATRATHSKAQMTTLAARIAEQEHTMRDLAAQLGREREEWQQRGSVDDRDDSLFGSACDKNDADEATPRRTMRNMGRPGPTPLPLRTRRSDGLSSDSGFDESDAESACFSLDTASSSSGVVTPSAASVLSPSFRGGPATGQQQLPLIHFAGNKGSNRHGLVMDDDSEWRTQQQDMPMGKALGGGGDGGQSQGPRAGAWGVVGNLQRENYRLRTRVTELEGAVEGCLSLVGA